MSERRVSPWGSDEVAIVAQMKRSRAWAAAFAVFFWIGTAISGMAAVVIMVSSIGSDTPHLIRTGAFIQTAFAFACATVGLLLHRYAAAARQAWTGGWQEPLAAALRQQNRVFLCFIAIVGGVVGFFVLVFLAGFIIGVTGGAVG